MRFASCKESTCTWRIKRKALDILWHTVPHGIDSFRGPRWHTYTMESCCIEEYRFLTIAGHSWDLRVPAKELNGHWLYVFFWVFSYCRMWPYQIWMHKQLFNNEASANLKRRNFLILHLTPREMFRISEDIGSKGRLSWGRIGLYGPIEHSMGNLLRVLAFTSIIESRNCIA